VRFWDTSAIVPLLVTEPNTPRIRELLDRDPDMAVWWGSPVECWSALARLQRQGRISTEKEGEARALLEPLRSAWYEVLPSEEVRLQARRLLRLHPLRAADSLQLAAAIVWAAGDEVELVAFDRNLREAAHLEGFLVV
jgi:uncharacterized protein